MTRHGACRPSWWVHVSTEFILNRDVKATKGIAYTRWPGRSKWRARESTPLQRAQCVSRARPLPSWIKAPWAVGNQPIDSANVRLV